MKIRTGDHVVIISGKDKGKTGTVLRVMQDMHRVVVSDINMRTKHIRSMPNRPGQIIRYEASLDVSNVMLIDPKTKKRTRVGYSIVEGSKKRIAKRSGEELIKGKAPVKKESATKEEAKTTKKKTEKAESGKKPEKTPFWKKVGFGAEALEEAEKKEPAHMKENHRVPDQGKQPDSLSHMRGE
jgi:large subunit ribosomal protein L24